MDNTKDLLNNINTLYNRIDNINKLHKLLKESYNPIIILTYNVFYKFMQNIPNECKPDKCTNNIVKVINKTNNKYDFIALQEPANINFIDKNCHILKNMTKRASKSIDGNTDYLITYYDKDKWHESFNGTTNMSSSGDERRMHIFIFDEKMIFINVHCYHYYGKLELMQVDINNAISKILNTYSNPDINQIFQDYRIIMVGDFNDDIKKMSNPFNITFNGIVRQLHLNSHNLNTCCITGNLETNDMWGQHADNILDSKGPPLNIKIPTWTKPASDHAPVYAELLP